MACDPATSPQVHDAEQAQEALRQELEHSHLAAAERDSSIVALNTQLRDLRADLKHVEERVRVLSFRVSQDQKPPQYSGARSQVREQQQLIDGQQQELMAKCATVTQLDAKVQGLVEEKEQVC